MVSNATSSTRISGPILVLARLAWVLIFLYTIGKLTLGTPLVYQELQEVCIELQKDCSQQLGPTTQDAVDITAAGLSLEQFARLATGFEFIQAIVWIGVGVMIFALRSDDWMALLVSAMMVMFTSGGDGDAIARAYPTLAWPAQAGFNLQNILLFLVIGLFPSGRFVPRWLRWYWLGMILLSLLPNEFDFLWVVGWISFLTLGPYSQIYRYLKASNPIERTQTKWVVYGFAMFALALLLSIFVQEINLLPDVFVSQFVFGLVALFIPLGFGVSILRYRLWDIDVLIRRTLVYSALTISLGLVFFGSITLMQSLFSAVSGQRSAVATVISTLLIAALFNPLRHRIQEGIDRRFFRRKYNAERIVEAFGARLRNEVDLDDISSHLLEAVAETLQPEHASLWMRPPADRRPLNADGPARNRRDS
jgi:hypothetical protein